MDLLHPQIAPWLEPSAHGCRVRLFVRSDVPVTAYLRTLPDNEEELVCMTPAGMDSGHAVHEAWLPWDNGNRVTRYCFKVATPGGQRWLAADGQHLHVPPEAVHFRIHPHDAPPAWLYEQVFYQVFPDRFRRADPSPPQAADFAPGAILKAWGEPVPREHPTNVFYGGDLPGVTAALDYLQHELGVSALYLNPVFASPSNHRYDTADYFRVEPRLGGDAALQQLCEALHERHMKIVLDAVVNHTGAEHPWFHRHPDWYAYNDDGSVRGWKGYPTLPVLDYAQPAVRQAMYAAPDSVLQHWLKPPYAIDGWRLDAVHMLGEGRGSWNNAHHMREMRAAVKRLVPQAGLIGEHFFEAASWLQGDQEDGAMNYYGFAHPVWAWVAGVDGHGQPLPLATQEFEQWLSRARAAIPYANQLAQLNLLNSHDTPRLLTLLRGDTAAMKLAVTLLMSYPGVPCIYYGDEIGLEGGADPDCRRCFEWDRAGWNTTLFEHYRALVRLRRERREWARGDYQLLVCEGDVFGYARYDASHATLVFVNRGAAADVTLDLGKLPVSHARWREHDSGQGIDAAAMTTLHLPACSSAVYLSVN